MEDGNKRNDGDPGNHMDVLRQEGPRPKVSHDPPVRNMRGGPGERAAGSKMHGITGGRDLIALEEVICGCSCKRFSRQTVKTGFKRRFFLFKRSSDCRENKRTRMCAFVRVFWRDQARQTASCPGCDCFSKASRNCLAQCWKQFPLMFRRKIDLLQKFGAVFLGSRGAICLILRAERLDDEHASLFPRCLWNNRHRI